MRLSIAVVSFRDPKQKFLLSLQSLQRHIALYGRDYGVESYMLDIIAQSSNLCFGRQTAIENALAANCTHLCYIDDDMVFNDSVIRELSSHKLPLVAANAVCKSANRCIFTAKGFDRNPLSSKGKSGIEEAWRVGTGLMLLDLKALEGIQKPYFVMTPSVGEDSYFCDLLREAGIKIHVDHDASQHIGHVGDYVYTLNSYT